MPKLEKMVGVGDRKRSHVVQCLCGDDGIQMFNYFEREQDVGNANNWPACEYEQVYSHSYGNAEGLWNRLRAMWRILWLGTWENGGLSMNKKSLIGLRDWINDTLVYWAKLEQEDADDAAKKAQSPTLNT